MEIDLSKVEIEPLFQDMVDFETFSKSDFRVVKIKACEAVKKSKKLLKFTLMTAVVPTGSSSAASTTTMSPRSWWGKTAVAITNLPPGR